MKGKNLSLNKKIEQRQKNKDKLKEQNDSAVQQLLEQSISYAEKGEYKQALEVLKKCQQITKNGQNSQQNNLSLYYWLGKTYYFLNDFQNGQKYFQKCHTLSLKISDKNQTTYLDNINDIRKKQDIQDQKLFKKGMRQKQYYGFHDQLIHLNKYAKIKQSRNDEKYLPKALFAIARIYQRLDSFNNSMQCYMKCLKLSAKIHGEKSNEYISTLNNMALMYDQKGYSEKAIQFYMKLIKAKQIQDPKDKNKLSRITNNNNKNTKQNNSNVLEATQQSQTEEFQPKILQYGQEVHQLLGTYSCMGNIYLAQKKYEQALQVFEKSIKILKQKFNGKQVLETAKVYSNIAIAHFMKQNSNQAINFMKKAFILKLKILGSNHPDTISSQNAYKIYLQVQQSSKQKKEAKK